MAHCGVFVFTSRFTRSYFKITPMDGCLLIGLPHFPWKKKKTTTTLCQGEQIEKAKKKKDQLHYIHRVASSMRRGRKPIDRSPIPRILFTHCSYQCLPEIQGVYRHRYKETSSELLRRKRKQGTTVRMLFAPSRQWHSSPDCHRQRDQKTTTTTQPAKKSGTRPSLIQTDGI